MKLHWVTWWPVPYWLQRFNALASHDDIELTAFFLGAGSEQLPYNVDARSWQFRHHYVARRAGGSGYGRVDTRVVDVRPVLRGSPDAIVINYGGIATTMISLFANLRAIPYHVFAPNTHLEAREKVWWKEALKREIFSHAKSVLVTGPLQRAYAREYAGPKSLIHEIGNPSPALPSPPADIELGRAPRQRVLYVGRLAREKGLMTLLEASAVVQERGVDHELALVGDGPLRHILAARASELGVNLALPGFTEGEGLSRQYAIASVFVLPSISEPWGLVVNEAMGFGLPVIVSDHVGCHPVLVRDGVNGYVVPSGNVEALAGRLADLLTNPKRRADFGDVGRTIVSQHTIEAWASATIAALRRR